MDNEHTRGSDPDHTETLVEKIERTLNKVLGLPPLESPDADSELSDRPHSPSGIVTPDDAESASVHPAKGTSAE
jgi:hypothetical protein